MSLSLKKIGIILVVLMVLGEISQNDGFRLSSLRPQQRSSSQNSMQRTTRLFEKSPASKGGKGFGKVTKPPAPVEVEIEGNSSNTPQTTQTNQIIETSQAVVDAIPTTSPTIDTKAEYNQLTKKQKADNLPYFQKRRQELKESIEGKRKRLNELEAGAKADPSVGAVPEMIADRMIRRIAVFFGIPVFGGLAIFAAAFFTYKKFDIVMEPAIIAYATQFPFVVGLLGITYAIISSSWDPVSESLVDGVESHCSPYGRYRRKGAYWESKNLELIFNVFVMEQSEIKRLHLCKWN